MPLIILVIDIDRETRERPHLWLARRGGSCGRKTRAAAGPKRRSCGRAAATDAASRRGRRRTRDRGRGHGVQHDEGASNMTAVTVNVILNPSAKKLGCLHSMVGFRFDWLCCNIRLQHHRLALHLP